MIRRQLEKSRNILMVSHVRPDGDAIGSLLALGRAMEYMGKRVTLYNESSLPAILRFLPNSKSIVNEIDDLDRFDTVVALDCSNMERVGSIAEKFDHVPALINIDHHLTNTGFGDYVLIDAQASSTGEILYRLIKEMDIPFDKTIASAIYTAIFTDTGSFRFQNTNRAAFAICGEMVGYGVDTYKVARKLFETQSLARLKLLNMVVDTIDISDNGKVSVMILTQEMLEETGTQVEDINGLVNYAKHIEDVQVAALIQETRRQWLKDDFKTYYISLRSKGTVDVSTLAAAFGGGGHHTAAGFTARSTIAELKQRIFKLSESL